MNLNKIKGPFFLFVRFLISFGILLYLFRKTDWVKLKSLISGIKFQYYILALSCVLGFQFLVAIRWKIICEAWDFRESIKYFFRNYLLGFSLNTVFPGIIAGDTLRSIFLVRSGLEWKRAGFSVLLDRGLGLMGILLILTISLPLGSHFLPQPLKLFLYTVTYGSIAVFFVASIGFRFLKRDFFKPLEMPKVLIPLLLGLIIQILFVIQFIFLAHSLNLSLKLVHYFVIIPIISFLSALPISISGLGLREGTLTYFLYLLNYPVEYGLSLGLLAYSLIILSALPGVFLYLKGREK
ncbi:MAG: flippase-like domain-containing protein [Caldimicrobium sp.]|nr:flippase-like domain-containing protein [Caldimicrobium sp.]MCX7613243.1 flippase-like domain-containing protein [Caldimicrobium sp.]MDW8182074.1 lysylphosphatidylglycerol synthase transmembrane domain-containing protein [Caldimicrobium sp.]